jgi:hypothetical protein
MDIISFAAQRSMAAPTKTDFDNALRTIGRPRGRQMDFLREHVNARGRALTARRLADAVGYKDYRGINLQYGLLARKIGNALGRKTVDLTLLVDFVRPKSVTNDEWIMVMHPEFATALKQAHWV